MLKKITIIDDDLINNMICERLLLHWGKVEAVNSFLLATQALDWQETLSPEQQSDVILLDINMPVMDGWGFLAALNEKLPQHQIKIILLTSSISEDDRDKAAAHDSLMGYLSKPLNIDELARLLALN